MLDAEEYLHLAIHAGSVGEHHACIAYLKEVLQRQPGNGKAIYLLAVQHAELGLFARAVSGMKAALSIDPTLEVARFQLGLLLLDGRRAAEAKEHFSRLTSSSDDELRTCCEAMVALADDNPGVAREKLSMALSLKSGNRALAKLMQHLLERISGKSAAAADDAGGSEISLGAYRQTRP